MHLNILTVCILFSGISFFIYAFSYFKTPYMKNEFKRFGLKKFALTIILLEILGGIGLLVGLKYNFMLIISSLGLAVLMLAGIVIRILVKDNLRIIFPAFFFMVLNAYIFWKSLYLN